MDITDRQSARLEILTRIDELDRIVNELPQEDQTIRRKLEERKKELRKALETS